MSPSSAAGWRCTRVPLGLHLSGFCLPLEIESKTLSLTAAFWSRTPSGIIEFLLSNELVKLRPRGSVPTAPVRSESFIPDVAKPPQQVELLLNLNQTPNLFGTLKSLILLLNCASFITFYPICCYFLLCAWIRAESGDNASLSALVSCSSAKQISAFLFRRLCSQTLFKK